MGVCVGQHTNNVADKKGQQDRSPCCVSWANKKGIHPVSHKHDNKGIYKTGPRKQTTSTKDMQETGPH